MGITCGFHPRSDFGYTGGSPTASLGCVKVLTAPNFAAEKRAKRWTEVALSCGVDPGAPDY